ncbi:MAG: insulinase family protein, partial [Ruminiclostridium sp.]|nr:insulinase family protein [Ruminiclostridium sp.]
DTEGQALETIRRVVTEFTENGPTEEELSRAREQSKANVVMGMESTQSRMSHAGRSLLFTGKILSAEEIIGAYDAVTKEDVMALAKEIFDWDKVSLSAVGQVRDVEEYKEILFG